MGLKIYAYILQPKENKVTLLLKLNDNYEPFYSLCKNKLELFFVNN